MSTTRLPELPEPDGESRGCRYHTEAQMHAYGLAVWKAAMETAGEIANQRAEQVRKTNTYRGRLSDAASFCVGQCEQIGMEIRSLPLPEQGGPQ